MFRLEHKPSSVKLQSYKKVTKIRIVNDRMEKKNRKKPKMIEMMTMMVAMTMIMMVSNDDDENEDCYHDMI